MTSEIWNDPGDWVTRLHGKLVARDLQYQGIKAIERMKLDPDQIGNAELIDTDPGANALLAAAAALGAVIGALREIPSFQGNIGLVGLEDLAFALLDLDGGGRPKMLYPRPGGKSSGDGHGRQMLKTRALVCVEILEGSGLTNEVARTNVANLFSAAGHRGRKGGPLSAKTLYEWSYGNDAKAKGAVRSAVKFWKEANPWPPTEAQALDYAKATSRDTRLLTQI